MEEDYDDINMLYTNKSPYSHLSRQQLINLFEEQNKKSDILSTENNRLKELIITNQTILGHKDKEIEMLNKRIEEKEKYIDLIQKAYEDKKQLSQDLKILVDKISEKNEAKKNPISDYIEKILDGSSKENKFLFVNIPNKNEEKEDSEKKSQQEKKLLKKKTSRRGKKKKEPNALKKPLTPYFLFCKDVRENLKKQGTLIKLIEASKISGEKWKNMTEEEKQPYKKLYELNREKYLRDKQNLNIERDFGIDRNIISNNNVLNNLNENKNLVKTPIENEQETPKVSLNKNTHGIDSYNNYNNFN